MKRLDERSSESRMLEIGTYGSMRGGKKKKRSLAYASHPVSSLPTLLKELSLFRVSKGI